VTSRGSEEEPEDTREECDNTKSSMLVLCKTSIFSLSNPMMEQMREIELDSLKVEPISDSEPQT